jgi:uncharacterized protein (TIGR02246 family)
LGDAEIAVRRVLDSYQSAVLAKDAEALMRLYDPAVRVFDAWGVWFYEGAAPWRKAIEAWFASLGAERVKVTFDEVRTQAAADQAVVNAIVTYAGLSAEGKELRQMQNRLTWCLRSAGGVFRIVHEHTSAPISFDESKAILRRTSP